MSSSLTPTEQDQRHHQLYTHGRRASRDRRRTHLLVDTLLQVLEVLLDLLELLRVGSLAVGSENDDIFVVESCNGVPLRVSLAAGTVLGGD